LRPGTAFGLSCLPYGIFSVAPAARARNSSSPGPGGAPRHPPPRTGRARRAGVAIGDSVLDVAAVADDLRLPLRHLFTGPALNRFLAAGPAAWREARERITEWLTAP